MNPLSSPELVHSLPRLPPRPADAHKGLFGRVLVIAGSRGMSGAAVLCSSAALRGGAGLVTVALPHEILPIVASGNPCYMTAPMPQDDDGRLSGEAWPSLARLVESASAVAVGPGLGQSQGLPALLGSLLEQTAGPLVLDADALNGLVGRLDLLARRQASKPAPVLTPHPGEFGRLTGLSTGQVQARRQELALAFAAEHRLVLVLKGHGTIVTDGRRVFVNPTGNPGMATGGSGDVLTGLIGALLAQGLEPFAAAQLGVYLHGRAGDLARDRLGEVSLIATDLLQELPAAFREQARR
jgi:NAD(P)H-hydrate epimerase